MQLEDYFDFVSEHAIRIRNTRVGIETVVDAYKQGASPEEIVIRYPTLSFQQVHATLTYYLANQPQVELYIKRVRDHQEAGWQAEQRAETDFVRGLRERLDRQRQQMDVRDEKHRPHAA